MSACAHAFQDLTLDGKMKKRTGKFQLSDRVFEPHEQDLIEKFLQFLARKYQFNLSDLEFTFQGIGVGLSKSTKLLALSSEVYPYFIKISDVASIQKEVWNFNRATAKIPPLHIPPLETVISSENERIRTDQNDGYALLAIRYITDTSKGEAPKSLFEAFARLDVYQSIGIIDEIFQVILRDLHAFHKLKETDFRPYKHHTHNHAVFAQQKNATLNSMLERYDKLVAETRPLRLPHGNVHGDLHCENIIMNSRNMPLIIDFEMMRTDGCLINDFAEFEISLTVAALDNDVELYGKSVRDCYNSSTMFGFYGVDKIIQSIRTIRVNLTHMLFNVAKIEPTKEFISELDYTYRLVLLRYICSYTWVSLQSMNEKRNLVVVGVLATIFDGIYSSIVQPT